MRPKEKESGGYKGCAHHTPGTFTFCDIRFGKIKHAQSITHMCD